MGSPRRYATHADRQRAYRLRVERRRDLLATHVAELVRELREWPLLASTAPQGVVGTDLVAALAFRLRWHRQCGRSLAGRRDTWP